MPKNPYASGSKRHQAWSKGFSDYEKGVWDKAHHEEEESTESAYDKGYSDQQNGKGREANPYPRGTEEHEDWLTAWNDSRSFSLEQGWSKEWENEESDRAAQSFKIPHEQNDLGYRKDGQPNGSAMPEPQGRQFMLVWRDGKTETISGKDIADAFSKAGYGAGAIGALDYYKEVKDTQDIDHDPL
jgi:ribosome modulation factor